jgi:hypothetical protein
MKNDTLLEVAVTDSRPTAMSKKIGKVKIQKRPNFQLEKLQMVRSKWLLRASQIYSMLT